MEAHWPYHSAFLDRARALVTAVPIQRTCRGVHLVATEHCYSEINLLRSIGAPPKNITLVCSAERALEAQDRIPDLHCIADDLRGAVREQSKRFVTAFFCTDGPLTNSFVDQIHTAISHGMADDGYLTVTFGLGNEAGAVLEMINRKVAHIPRIFEEAGFEESPAAAVFEESAAEPDGVTAQTVLPVIQRIDALHQMLHDRCSRGKRFWHAKAVAFYGVPGRDNYEVVVHGPLQRGKSAPQHRGQDGQLHVGVRAVVQLYRDENGDYLRDVAVEYAQKLEGRISPRQRLFTVAALFDLLPEQVSPWLTK